MSDAYRAHRLIFQRFSAAQFEKAFKRIRAASTLPLGAEVKQRLADGLYKAQKNVLVMAVDADLSLFRRGNDTVQDNILYHEPGKEKLAALRKILGDPDAVQAFVADGDTHTDSRRAYTFYCETLLGDGFRLPHLWSESGRFRDFKKRNPMAVLLLQQVFDNYVGNLIECLQRVSADIAALQACFVGGRTIKGIASMTATGSDSQRGGKQVLFLDLETDDQAVTRVVYKPSDVEIDFLLVGHNDGAVNDFLATRDTDPGYPGPNPSLFELVNRTLATAALPEPQGRALSTYVVLPRNPGSGFSPQQRKIPIRDSYGYLEFLWYRPSAPREPLGPMDSLLDFVRSQNGQTGQAADWIVDNIEDAAACMRNWGRVGQLAAIMLMRDLHFENRRLRHANPTLIDLEMTGTGTLDKIGETAVFQRLQEPVQLTGGDLTVAFIDGVAGPVGREHTASTLSWSVDQLYLAAGDDRDATRIRFTDPAPLADVQRGMSEILEQLTPEALKSWIKQTGLGQVIVRYLSLEKFGEMVERELASILAIHKPTGTAREELERYWQLRMQKRRRDQVALWLNGNRSADQRAYALETPEYIGMDLLNLDSPRFFRRMNSRDVLASDGTPVKFDRRYFDLDELFPGDEWRRKVEAGLSKAQAAEALPFDRFRTTTGLDDLAANIDLRLGLDDAARQALMRKDIDNIAPPMRSITLGKRR